MTITPPTPVKLLLQSHKSKLCIAIIIKVTIRPKWRCIIWACAYVMMVICNTWDANMRCMLIICSAVVKKKKCVRFFFEWIVICVVIFFLMNTFIQHSPFHIFYSILDSSILCIWPFFFTLFFFLPNFSWNN